MLSYFFDFSILSLLFVISSVIKKCTVTVFIRDYAKRKKGKQRRGRKIKCRIGILAINCGRSHPMDCLWLLPQISGGLSIIYSVQ
jgi:hypothetical protein